MKFAKSCSHCSHCRALSPTIKNAAVLIEHDGEEIHAERNEIGDLVAKVPENASVTVTYISQIDAIAFDQWLVSGLDDSTDVKQNPLRFQMPAGEKGVTMEAMTKMLPSKMVVLAFWAPLWSLVLPPY